MAVRRSFLVALLAAVLIGVPLAMLLPRSGAPSVAPGVAVVTPSVQRAIPGVPSATDFALPAGGVGQYGNPSVVCAARDSCVVVGAYTIAGGGVLPMLATETRGRWAARAIAPPADAATRNASLAILQSLACTRSTDCVATGNYLTPKSVDEPMIVSETNGVWGRARRLRLPAALAGQGARALGLGSLACTSRGNCEAVAGYYTGPGAALVATETDGIWRRVTRITPPAGAVAQDLGSIACSAAGDCVAVGAAGNRPMLAVQTDGVWARARAVAPPTGVRFTSQEGVGHLYAVTCPSAGNCVAVGNYVAANGHGAMVISEVHGVWRRAQRVPSPANATRKHHVLLGLPPLLLSVACTQQETCAAVGTYSDAYINHGASGEPMIARETNGHWRRAEQINLPRRIDPPAFIQTSWLTSVACPDLRHCVAVGFYTGRRQRDAMLLTQNTN